MTTTGQTTTTPAPWLTSAANNNLNFAQTLEGAGFTPYKGQQVAGFSPQQQQSFAGAGNISNAAGSTLGLAAPAISNYTTAGPGSVAPSTIASQMSPYMNQYVDMALQPQLAQAARTYMQQSQANQGAATSAGAFGDPRANILQSNLGLNYALENQGLVGNAYNAAFNTAIGAGAQDVSNNLNAQMTNANLREAQLGRELTGANTILGANTGATTLENQFGAQQTAQSQAGLNAKYNQWLMAQQYPFQTIQAVNSAIGAGQAGAPQTQTTMAPNNAGYGILGSLLGAAGSAAGGYFTGAGVASALRPAAPAAAADGGDVPEDKPVLVGERGPEVIVPKTASNVIPYEKLRDAMKKKKGVRQTDGLASSLGIAA